LCLYADLMTVKVDNVSFTVYQQEEPTKVVFLMGGVETTSKYFFNDLSIFQDYPDTLFVGVCQSYKLEDDLEKIIDFVKTEYEITEREQWSFYGFSLGAYKTFDTALRHFSDTFGNYAAIGGGTDPELEEEPNINFLYLAYGEHDFDKSSADFAEKCLDGYISSTNFKKEVYDDIGHSYKEAKLGLQKFLMELKHDENRESHLMDGRDC